VALARALINEPKVLLLDEPLGALDFKLRKAMQIEIKNIHNQLGTTFVCVTHDQNEALTMSDRIVIMNRGRIVEDGTPIEIYNNPKRTFSAGFLGDANIYKGRVTEIDKGKAIRIMLSNAFHLEVNYGDDLEVGDVVKVIIRPEKLSIARQEYKQFDFISFIREGVVKNRLYIGPVVTYELNIDENIKNIVVTEDYGDLQKIFNIGEKVKIYTEKRNVIILKDSEE
jgi:spermidine/putrescine transport system ATP-binding protein